MNQTSVNDFAVRPRGGADELPRPPAITRRNEIPYTFTFLIMRVCVCVCPSIDILDLQYRFYEISAQI